MAARIKVKARCRCGAVVKFFGDTCPLCIEWDERDDSEARLAVLRACL